MKKVWTVFAALVLAGCGWMNDGEGLILDPSDDYMDAEQDQVLVVPEDLRNLTNTDPFPIPVAPQPINPRYYPRRPPLPDAIYANDNRDEVRIQTLGERRWLVVPEAPTTVWPKLKQFLAENGIAVTYDAPQVGRLNSDWLEIEDRQYRDVIRTVLRDAKQSNNLQSGQDRVLVRVEQGLRPLTTEVHLRHENDSLTLPVRDDIENLDGLFSDLAGAERDLLSEIGAYIVAKVSEQTVSKVALQIGSSEKAALTLDDSGDPLLKLYLDYDRAWATLGQALENAQIEVASYDRETGAYFVNVPMAMITGEDERSFFCRITFSCERSDTEYFLLLQLLNPGEREFDVVVQDGETRGRVDPDLAQQVLVMIREYGV